MNPKSKTELQAELKNTPLSDFPDREAYVANRSRILAEIRSIDMIEVENGNAWAFKGGIFFVGQTCSIGWTSRKMFTFQGVHESGDALVKDRAGKTFRAAGDDLVIVEVVGA